jgi:DNA-binding transcriptional ArsR family regulator
MTSTSSDRITAPDGAAPDGAAPDGATLGGFAPGSARAAEGAHALEGAHAAGSGSGPRGDADPAAVAALFADPARSRVLAALADGRSLPASVLADEAGVSAPAASAHLAKLREGGLITMEKSGRHRYYRLAGGHVAAVLEALSGLGPGRPVRSLRAHTHAAALRRARRCYDHLAGRLGVELTAALVERGALRPGDGVPDTRRRAHDPLSSPLPSHPYELGPYAPEVFAAVGVDLDAEICPARPTRRPLLRFCVDWSEQRHHLAGRLGATLLSALLDQEWVRTGTRRRTLTLTDRGRDALGRRLGLDMRDGRD